MKTNSTWKLWTLALMMILSVTACKKNKTEETKPEPVEVKLITITELNALSTGATVKVPDGRKIKGIVISDASAKNIDSKTIVLQEATDKPGIAVTFDAAQTFAIGDELELTISNQTLARVNGEIVLQNLPAANAKKTGTGIIAPRSTNIADINTNKAAWNGTLVTIGNGMFSGTGKYTGTLSYSVDGSSIKSVIAPGAAFENTAYPVLIDGLTGIVRIIGEDVFLNIRNGADTKSPETFVYVEDFSAAVPRTYSEATAIGTRTRPYTGYPLAAVGIWKGGDIVTEDGIVEIKNLPVGSTDPDASFLLPGKNYYRTYPQVTAATYARLLDPTDLVRYGTEWNYFSNKISLFRAEGGNNLDPLVGLKNITIVLAGSKSFVKNADPDAVVTKDATETGAFDAAKDGFNVNLYTNQLEKVFASPIFHSQGQWQTVVIKDVDKLLLELEKTGSKRILRLTFASAVNKRGTFTFGNAAGSSTSVISGSPVVIDKIIFEYSVKPSWAK